MAKEKKQTAGNPLLDKVPPHNIEAEMATLGSMMLDRDALGLAAQMLDPESFYRREHQLIFKVLIELYDKNTGLDLVIMQEELRRQGILDDIAGGAHSGTAYLADLAGSVPSAANVEYYAKIVMEKALLRGLIDSAGQIVRDAFASTDDAEEILDRSEQRIFAVTEKKLVGEATHIRPILQEVFSKLDLLGNKHVTGLSTGFYELDEITLGLQPGEMIVLAARPSMGKSALALNIAEHVAADQGSPVAFFSLEMGKQDLAIRLVCSRYRHNTRDLRRGMLSKDESMRLGAEVNLLYDVPMFIDDTATLRVLDLRAKCRRLKAMQDVQLVIVDYLQLMSNPGAESRQVEVTKISQGIKALARELGIPVIAISQLRRAAEDHRDMRPRLRDLRESGAIEQDAD
ncbi:MAG: replicative DNA helicase, partial [Phycisphaerae bacterium]|nr:replicative DNA helicase [Phycisphaerae bacterium]